MLDRFMGWNKRRKIDELFLKLMSIATPDVELIKTDEGVEVYYAADRRWRVLLSPMEKPGDEVPF